MSIADIQAISRQIGFAIARKWRAHDRGDTVAKAEAEAEIQRLRPLVERPPTADELAEAEAMAANIQLQGRVPVFSVELTERKFINPGTRRREVKLIPGERTRHR